MTTISGGTDKKTRSCEIDPITARLQLWPCGDPSREVSGISPFHDVKIRHEASAGRLENLCFPFLQGAQPERLVEPDGIEPTT
jgi:hypothetical protein